MLNKNKAQVTVFVVLGIILIVVVSFLYANSRFELIVDSDTRAKNQIRDVIEACISDSASRGAFLLGFQGGYIEIPQEIKLDASRHSRVGGLYIPSWDSEQISTVPTIPSMQEELNIFISQDSYPCIQSNLIELQSIFDIELESLETYSVESEIENENINIEAFLNVKFSEKNSNEILSVDDYFVSLEDVKLGDMYELASQIYEFERETYFLEELVLDQIYSAADYSDRSISLPSEGMSFSCASQIWTRQGLINNLLELNENNFKYLQFDGTYSKEYLLDANFREEYGNLENRAYFESHYVFELQNPKRSYENYEVNTFVPISTVFDENVPVTSNPFLSDNAFSVTPSSGEIIKPMTLKVGSGKIPIPCIQIYHHLYSLDYDLIISLQDREEDLNGYIFQFPLRVKVENNAPKQKDALPLETNNDEERLTVNNENYCSEQSYQYPLTVYTRDIYENPLSDVNITYQCITLSCQMGSSDHPEFEGFKRTSHPPILETNFPFCVNGILIGEKDGYHKAQIFINTSKTITEVSTTPSAVLALTPLKEFELDESSILIGFDDETSKRILEDSSEFVYINVENKNEDFESSAIWPAPIEDMNTIAFLDKDDVNYNLSVIYVDEKGELKAMFDIENYKPQINIGNEINIVIPAASGEINEENFMDFYEASKELVSNPQVSGYGIFFR